MRRRWRFQQPPYQPWMEPIYPPYAFQGTTEDPLELYDRHIHYWEAQKKMWQDENKSKEKPKTGIRGLSIVETWCVLLITGPIVVLAQALIFKLAMKLMI